MTKMVFFPRLKCGWVVAPFKRYDFFDERRLALQVWADLIEKCERGDDVPENQAQSDIADSTNVVQSNLIAA